MEESNPLKNLRLVAYNERQLKRQIPEGQGNWFLAEACVRTFSSRRITPTPSPKKSKPVPPAPAQNLSPKALSPFAMNMANRPTATC
jgi:hypothetical protein